MDNYLFIVPWYVVVLIIGFCWLVLRFVRLTTKRHGLDYQLRQRIRAGQRAETESGAG